MSNFNSRLLVRDFVDDVFAQALARTLRADDIENTVAVSVLKCDLQLEAGPSLLHSCNDITRWSLDLHGLHAAWTTTWATAVASEWAVEMKDWTPRRISDIQIQRPHTTAAAPKMKKYINKKKYSSAQS